MRIGQLFAVTLIAATALVARPAFAGNGIDQHLAEENEGRKLTVAPVIDDWAFLRRASVDLIGRIPVNSEIEAFFADSADTRREKLVDRLLSHDRFNDRWTVFFSDMLRIRSGRSGGDQLLAFVNRSLRDKMGYDELVRRLLSANGRPDTVPEVGFILGDDADPMALAGATSQIFLGKRMACAQCHDHPFDKWTQEEFYNLAAFFGKTRRVQRDFGRRMVYTTEVKQSSVLWPPEMDADDRAPRDPAMPYKVDPNDPTGVVSQLTAMRAKKAHAKEMAAKAPEKAIDDLLGEVDKKAEKGELGADDSVGVLNVNKEAAMETRGLKVYETLYKGSELRTQLATWITNPHNKQFSRAFVNRLWAELIGSGFVNPIDDFTATNKPSHPKTLDYLTDQFILSEFDLRAMVRMIALSDTYQRGNLDHADKYVRQASEEAFVATRTRRMISEVLYDSVVYAGHLLKKKHLPGENKRVIEERVRVRVEKANDPNAVQSVQEDQTQMAMANAKPTMKKTGYDLEQAIELDFDNVLKMKEEEAAPKVEMLMQKSNEEIEAERMLQMNRPNPRYSYTYKTVKKTIDDNPSYSSSMRMRTPAPRPHFLRVFGQPSREGLGEFRDEHSSMRQALMMLNGKLTHEASRVGKLEPMYKKLVGPKADLDSAIKLAYREILTREPDAEELSDARQVVAAASDKLAGMRDLRWVLLNCHEFRYVP